MSTPGVTTNLSQRDRSLLEAIPEAIILSSLQGDIVAANPPAERLFQYDHNELIGKPITLLIAEHFHNWYEQQRTVLIHGVKEAAEAEIQCYRKDQSDFLAEVGYGMVKDGDTRMLVNTFRDIAHEQQEQIQEAMELSAAKMNQANMALLRIARSQNLHEGNLEDLFFELTERVSRNLSVARVGIWLYTDRYTKLVSQALFDLSTNKHTSGEVLSSINYPNYFKSLAEGRYIAANEARTDPRTNEYLDDYLIPNNIYSMLDAPIRIGGRLIGVVCLEHVETPRQWTPEEQTFAGSLSDMISIAVEASERVKARQELERLNRELESRIEERTEELNATNRLLELELEERKRTAEALKQITDTLPVMVYQYTVDRNQQQKFTFLSSGAQDVLGISTAEAQGDFNAVLRQMHPDDAVRVSKSIADAVTAQEKWEDEFRIVHPNGQIRWVRASSVPVRKQGDNVVWNGIANDFTAQKEIEEALQESEQRWQFAREVSGDGLWDWDIKANSLFLSEQCKTMFGYEENDIDPSFDAWKALLHPDDKEAVLASLMAHVQGETPAYFSEHRVLCKDGSYKWAEARGKVIARTSDGEPSLMVGTYMDMSEPKTTD